MNKKIQIMQVKSSIGRLTKHKATLRGLGLKRIGHVVQRDDTRAIRGMIKKIFFMLKVKEVKSSEFK